MVYPRKKATISQYSLEEGQTEKYFSRFFTLRKQEFVNLGGSRFHVLSYPTQDRDEQFFLFSDML